MGVQPLDCWDCGFDSCRRQRYLSLVSVACCQAEVSASGWSLVQRSPTECGCVSNCQRWGGLGPIGAVTPKERKITKLFGLIYSRVKNISQQPSPSMFHVTRLLWRCKRQVRLKCYYKHIRKHGVISGKIALLFHTSRCKNSSRITQFL
jgi:hypothetical protein